MKITPELKSWLIKHANVSPSITSDALWREAAARAMFETREGEAGHLSQEKLAELTIDKGAQGARKLTDILGRIERRLGTTGPSPDDLFGDGDQGGSVAVGKRSYNATKSVATHAKFGKVRDEYGRPATTRSEFDNARSGSYLKFLARRAGLDVAWRSEDSDLLDSCFESPWVGSFGGDDRDIHNPVSGSEVKALLDDSPSRGIEVNPIWFDSDLVGEMLLSGELAPLVDLKPMSRGRRVDGGSI